MARRGAIFSIFVLLTIVNLTNSLRCYVCENCVSNNVEETRVCGLHIAPSHDVSCSKVVAKGQEKSGLAKRACVIYSKAEGPKCNEGTNCHFCQSDLCNNAPNHQMASKIPIFLLISVLFYFTY